MKVKIKSWEAMKEEFGIDYDGDIRCKNVFTRQMEEWMPEDRIIEVERFRGEGTYLWKIIDGTYVRRKIISTDMIEEIIKGDEMKGFKVGEYCRVWGNVKTGCMTKKKRIYIGSYNGVHYAVDEGSEEKYKNGETFYAVAWRYAKPIEDPVYYYRWKKVSKGFIQFSSPMTDECAEKNKFIKGGWTKIEESKTTFEDFKG